MSRRARLWWSGCAAVLFLVASAYLTVTLTYPVEHGSVSSSAQASIEPGTRVAVVLSVRNPGPLPITVQRVWLDTPDVENLAPVAVVDLAPRAEATVRLDLQVTGVFAYARCTGFTVLSVNVDYRVAGMHRTRPIALPSGWTFRTACGSSTPRPPRRMPG